MYHLRRRLFGRFSNSSRESIFSTSTSASELASNNQVARSIYNRSCAAKRQHCHRQQQVGENNNLSVFQNKLVKSSFLLNYNPTRFNAHSKQRSTPPKLRPKRKSLIVKVTPLDSRFKMDWPKITLFGDSITRRSVDPENGYWGSMIAYHFGEYFQTDVRGFEGYNTRWALELMPKLFSREYLEKVSIFIPFFGHNDSWIKEFALHVPVAEYEQNYRSILNYLNKNGVENRKIILITPTWWHKEEANKFMAQQQEMVGIALDKHFDEAKQYAEVIKKLAKEYQIDYVDFFEESANFKPLEDMFCDGIHFSKLGAEMLYNKLEPIIERKIETEFQKSTGDLYHALPFEMIPEVKKQIESMKRQAKSED